MRSNGKRASEWSDAEYHARKAREAALGGKSAPAGTNGRKKADAATEGLEMDLLGTQESVTFPENP